MQLKNLNPYTGLKQIVSGYIHVPRIVLLNFIKLQGHKPHLLSYYLILVTSADWDVRSNRKSFIRYSTQDLAKLWSLKQSTLESNISKLLKLNYIQRKNSVLKITNYQPFECRSAQTIASCIKQNCDNEILRSIFPVLTPNKQGDLQSNHHVGFSSLFKIPFKVGLDSINKEKKDIKKKGRSLSQQVADDIPF